MKTRKILASPLFSGRTEYGFLCWNSFDYLLRMGKTFLPAVNVEKRAKLFVENWKLVYNFSSFFAARKNVFQLKTKQNLGGKMMIHKMSRLSQLKNLEKKSQKVSAFRENGREQKMQNFHRLKFIPSAKWIQIRKTF